MAEPFHIVKAVYNSAVGVDIRWTQMDGGFDFKKESFELLCTILQPTRPIENY